MKPPTDDTQTQTSARKQLKALQKQERKGREMLAEHAWRQGRSLHNAREQGVAQTLGYESFGAFLDENFDQERSTLYDHIRLYLAFTLAQARRFGVRKLILAIRLVETLDLVDEEETNPAKAMKAAFAKLQTHELALPKSRGGGTVTFAKASVAQLRDVLRLLKDPASDIAPTPEQQEALVEQRQVVAALAEKDGKVAKVRKQLRFYAGRLRCHLSLVGIDEFKAGVKLLETLVRRSSPLLS